MLKGFNGVVDTALEIASDPKHPRAPDALREMNRVLFPAQGSKVEVNVAGRDFYQDAQHQENSIIVAELAGKTTKEIQARLKEIEARFVRDEPPMLDGTMY